MDILCSWLGCSEGVLWWAVFEVGNEKELTYKCSMVQRVASSRFATPSFL